MCGIAGFFGMRTLAPGTVERMLASLRARGPDAEHTVFWTSGLLRTSESFAPNGLIHTRLAIIDPRPDADQPMANATGDIWVSYNGEVYDWADDAKVLTASGFHFRTRSDTEFILHAYEHWGIGFVEHLRGMFAIAICDLRKRVVHLIRDRLGLKPIVYAQRDGGFAFASTVRALLPWFPRGEITLSAEGIDAYLAHRSIPAPRTLFSGMSRVPPAHLVSYDLATGSLTTREYWRPAPSTAPWLATLDTAIRIRTVADRPLGLFLSSGIDSTTIACRLARLGFGRLQSFTAAFPDSTNDESVEARTTAKQLGFPNLAIELPTSITDSFADIVADLDEPFADPSSFPTWFLSRETSRHVKAVLCGDGGDELFAGYKRYRSHLRTRWRRNVVLPWVNSHPQIGASGWQRIAQEVRLDWASAYTLRFSGLTPCERAFLEPDFDPQPHYWRMPKDADRVQLATLLEIDRLNYLPEYILRKSDLCSMAHGLELRAPLLDHYFVAAVIGLPATQRFSRPPKQIFRAALAPELEVDSLYAKKRGFNPPLSAWLRKDLAPRLAGLGSRLSTLTRGQLSSSRIDRFVTTWLGSGGRFDEQLLQLLILDESLAQLAALSAQT